MEECTLTEPSAGSSLNRGITIGICAVFQTILFLHYMVHIKNLLEKKTALWIIILFISSHTIANLLQWTEFIRQYIVTSFYPQWFLNSLSFCEYTAFSNRLYVPLWYGIIIILLLLRLFKSFECSIHRLSTKTFITLLFFVTVPIISLQFIYIIMIQKPCISHFINNSDHFYCVDELIGIRYYLQFLGILLIAVYNIFMGVLFAVKLHAVMKFGVSDTFDLKLSDLMIKNTIITFFMVISTVLFWILMVMLGWKSCLHFDVVVNTALMSMTSAYNNKYYVRLCKPMLCCLYNHHEIEIQLAHIHIASSNSTIKTSEQPSNKTQEQSSI
eukprot:164312_1